jgi:hypothetical protein
MDSASFISRTLWFVQCWATASLPDSNVMATRSLTLIKPSLTVFKASLTAQLSSKMPDAGKYFTRFGRNHITHSTNLFFDGFPSSMSSCRLTNMISLNRLVAAHMVAGRLVTRSFGHGSLTKFLKFLFTLTVVIRIGKSTKILFEELCCGYIWQIY